MLFGSLSYFFEKIKKNKKNKKINKKNSEIIINFFIQKNFNENSKILIFSIFPNVLTNIIMKYTMLAIDSEILLLKEEEYLKNILYNKIGNFSTELLFRASEHNFNSNTFHEKCDNKGPTLLIVQNEYDHIYGGYSNISWNKNKQTETDPTAFLWCVRPQMKIFELNRSQQVGEQAMWNYEGYGPLYGKGNDLWITNKCNENKSSGYGSGQSFNCTGKDYGAKDKMLNTYNQCYCVIREYEVFKIYKDL
tara:strand:+ start:217 stop:963 length:747 start_codon:yes stop_codon:yes gene_type:complete